ncbi:SDR family oxidoreductase [Amycolatopsis minnesotensis]|uniref:SDR family oxidoreductase n=1 Tax=Amycolatopsis minnesotensis TaxID=337894 RepID=A0ABN2QS88_9PSEU
MPARTILLTGASGLVGSALARALDGHHVISLAHRKPVDGQAVHGDITRPWLGLHPGEYRRLAGTVDVVVHCAGLVHFNAPADRLHDVNVRGVGHILCFAEDAGARIVHGSTAYVTRAADGITLSAYAHSKASGETLVRESGLSAAIARISTVVGDSSNGRIARLQAFHYLLGAALSGQLPFLPASTATHIDLLPTDTLAHALAALATNDQANGDYWLTAGPAATPLSRIIDIGFPLAAGKLRDHPRRRDIDPTVFRPRIIDPAVCDQVIDMALSHTKPDAAPSVIQHIVGLMATYNNAPELPTSLGTIPGGPPAPNRAAQEKAVEALCRHLLALPHETWHWV